MKYALATLTSMGLRITPENRMAVQNSNLFYLCRCRIWKILLSR